MSLDYSNHCYHSSSKTATTATVMRTVVSVRVVDERVEVDDFEVSI